MHERADLMGMKLSSRKMDGAKPSSWSRASLLNRLVSLAEGRYWAYLLIAPSLLLVGAVVIYPIIDGILLSFREYRLNRPALGTPWIGLEHYRRLMTDPIIRIALRNTLIWVPVGAVSQFLIGMIAALALHRQLRGMGAARILVLVPWLLPSVVSANMWRFMLDARLGIVNDLLVRVGLFETPRAWFTSPGTALYEVLGVELWKNFPFFTLSHWPDFMRFRRNSTTQRASMGVEPGGGFGTSPFPC